MVEMYVNNQFYRIEGDGKLLPFLRDTLRPQEGCVVSNRKGLARLIKKSQDCHCRRGRTGGEA